MSSIFIYISCSTSSCLMGNVGIQLSSVPQLPSSGQLSLYNLSQSPGIMGTQCRFTRQLFQEAVSCDVLLKGSQALNNSLNIREKTRQFNNSLAWEFTVFLWFSETFTESNVGNEYNMKVIRVI